MKMLRSLFAALVLTSAFTANATLINVSMDAEIIFGVATGATGTVEFEYDDALLTGTGDEVLEGDQFTMILNILGQVFTEADDVDAPDYPWLFFTDGLITGMDLIIAEDSSTNPTDINELNVLEINGADVLNNTLLLATNDSAQIPEPAALTLILAGLFALRRRT